MKQVDYQGEGSLNNLDEVLNRENIESIFIVCHKGSYRKSGAQSVINSILDNINIDFFHEYQLNPRYKDVIKGVKKFREKEYDLIMAVGGGSAIDVAKLINIFSFQEEPADNIITGEAKISNRGVPLIAIPTTAGTGSESTHFAVVYLEGVKHSVAHQYILPDYFILDPQLLSSLPASVMASSGMDALCQAIESYWNINSTEKSKEYAKKAIKLVYNNLEEAVHSKDIETRGKILKGSNFAGKAINITKTTAAHAFSYKITTKCGIPHGHAVALSIGELLEFNFDVEKNSVIDKRGKDYVRDTLLELFSLLEGGSAEQTKEKIKTLMQNINLNVNLSDLCSKISIEDIIDSVNLNRLKNNPVEINNDDIRNIFSGVM